MNNDINECASCRFSVYLGSIADRDVYDCPFGSCIHKEDKEESGLSLIEDYDK